MISSGIYGYPKDEAWQVATAAIRDFLGSHDLEVFLVIFDKGSLVIGERLLGEVESYIDEHYVSEPWEVWCEGQLSVDGINVLSSPFSPDHKEFAAPATGLDHLVGKLDEPFSETLLRLIDVKGKTDVEVYKRANLDRKLFSKIRTGKGYMPSKRTAVALALALELTLGETDDLLKRAGYALSHSQKFDVIVEYFITRGSYDIFEINQVLFKYDLPLLGG